MPPILPLDLILLLCEELAVREDFQTLFVLALAGRFTASSAILWLYRVHNRSSIRGGENDSNEMSKTGAFGETTIRARVAQQKQTVWKWAVQWRSLIRSSLNTTLMPYCLYIRTLDLGNLEELLNDHIFQESVQDDFFADDLSTFLRTHDTPLKMRHKKTRGSTRKISAAPIVKMVGESITRYVSVSADTRGGSAALEELAGSIPAEVLPSWISRLSRLSTITLWDGSVLDEEVALAVTTQCPDFDMLSLFHCRGSHVDADLAGFIGGLRPNSLRALEILSHNDIGVQTFVALNTHHQSLKHLKLSDLTARAVETLSLLSNCTALENLYLHDKTGFIDFAILEEVRGELKAWFTACKKLRDVRIEGFVNGPDFLTSLCLQDDIQLRSLCLNCRHLDAESEFHHSLANQGTLEALELRGDPDTFWAADVGGFVSSICQLKYLKDLKLLECSDNFRAPEIRQVANALSELELFSVSGYEVDDTIWPSLSRLTHLRNMSFHAITAFTFDGILSYISNLGSGNQGLLLSIMCGDIGSDLDDAQMALLRNAIAEKVNGTFEFVMHREPESETNSESD